MGKIFQNSNIFVQIFKKFSEMKKSKTSNIYILNGEQGPYSTRVQKFYDIANNFQKSTNISKCSKEKIFKNSQTK